MYGLVNGALKEMIVSCHGQDCWQEIAQRAGVSVEAFVATEGYSDESTFALVEHACETLQTNADEFLRQFGYFWLQSILRGAYGELLRSSGRSFWEVLTNLPNLHSRVRLAFPHLQPPSFRCTDIRARSVRLHYASERAGLGAFVEGLIHGLGVEYSESVLIDHVVQKANGAHHDEYLISW